MYYTKITRNNLTNYLHRMQLFIDSADPKEIATAWDWGIIDGVTTNPSLAAKIGTPYPEIVEKILDILDPDSTLSLEVTATDYEGIVSQGKALADLDERIVVKVPCTAAGIKATHKLSSQGILVNVTLVFSARQALLAAKAGAFYVSPFAGRLEDIESEADDRVIQRIVDIYDKYQYHTQILYASVRTVQHVEMAAIYGVDITTCPFPILQSLVEHPLTDKGLEKFLADWRESGLQLPS